METKICKKCGVEKELCEYNKDKYSKDGFRYRCRTCTSTEYRDFYDKNRENEINRQVNYQKTNKEFVNQNRNIRHNNRYKNDLFYRLSINLRNRIKLFIKSTNFDLEKNKTYDNGILWSICQPL